MEINYALILSAGLGTRMGEIGKQLPKVLWPIFNKTLLELQIDYCESLGIKKIYINTHYLHDEIVSYLKAKRLDEKVVVLHEPTLLDSGGAIHNLAQRKEVQYRGNLLLVNGDQFLMFSDEILKKSLEKLKTGRAALFGIMVDKDENYNETKVQNETLVEISKKSGIDNYLTYSGLGLLKLDELAEVPGVSKFFDTVANYKKEKVFMINVNPFEYWDFGTAPIYSENIFRIIKLKNQNLEIHKFLKKHCVDLENIDDFASAELNSINLKNNGRFIKNCLVSGETIQKI